MIIIATAQISCVLGYEEIISFDQNSTSSLDSCSKILWYPDISEGYISSPALRSGPIRNSGISCVEKTVVGPANINFFWKVDQDKNRVGDLSFKVDGQIILLCTSSHWSPVSYAVASGTHTLSWEYRKLYSYPEFSGAGWIDDVNIVYDNGTPLIRIGPENYIFDQQLASIEKNISLIEDRIDFFDSMQNLTEDFVDQQLVSIKKNISMIEKGLEPLGSLQNITENIVFIHNDRNLNLTKEINKYKNKVIILEDGIYLTNGMTISTTNVYIRPMTKLGAILDGNRSSDGILIKNAGNVTIDSFIINNSECTLCIDNSNNIQISNNLISDFKYYGILLNNSCNCLIDFNRLYTNYCNSIIAINLMEKSNKNSLIFNDIHMPLCSSPSPSGMKLYVLNNSTENSVQSLNKGYIQENSTCCRIFGNNEYECHYARTTTPAPMDHESSNIWSFLAYDVRDFQ